MQIKPQKSVLSYSIKSFSSAKCGSIEILFMQLMQESTDGYLFCLYTEVLTDGAIIIELPGTQTITAHGFVC